MCRAILRLQLAAASISKGRMSSDVSSRSDGYHATSRTPEIETYCCYHSKKLKTVHPKRFLLMDSII